jgi:predicted acetyltransferase
MLKLIEESNFNIFDELVQDYEEEFSPLTGKKKSHEGKYSVDVDWRPPNVGYYWEEDSHVVGFCIVDLVDNFWDIAEFYVIPAYRMKKIGKKMAFSIFQKHQGQWQVRQILGAESAQKFWRRIISDFTNGNYIELQIDDAKWGQVVCQRFVNST